MREIIYTEPAVRGDTSGKVLKPAKLATGHEVPVPAFCATGDKIEIDTRTNEYKRRVSADAPPLARTQGALRRPFFLALAGTSGECQGMVSPRANAPLCVLPNAAAPARGRIRRHVC